MQDSPASLMKNTVMENNILINVEIYQGVQGAASKTEKLTHKFLKKITGTTQLET